MTGSYDGSEALTVEIPSGGGVDVSGASVGQIIKVAAVDDTGKPTAWEPVDLPEQVQSDWEQNDESQADFVKNRPFYIVTEPTTIVEEKSLSLTRQPNSGFKAGVVFDTYFSYSEELKKTSISSNDKLRITFDGTVYDCDAYYDDSLGYCFGNYALTTNEGREDTGEPFFITIEEENNYYVGYYLTLSFYTEQTECTVKIEELVKTVQKIDSKFIKYDIDTGAGGQSIIENNTEHNIASGWFSHAEGNQTTANGNSSHAEGYQTTASGNTSHAEGYGTIASQYYSHAEGIYNIEDTEDKYLHIVGNGASASARSNAHTLDWKGNAWFAGSVECTSIILKSSTAGSTKKFMLTVDDNGTISVKEM